MLPRRSRRTPTSRPTIENVDEDRRAVEGMDIQRKSGHMKRLGVRAVHRCGLFRIAANPRRHKCQSTASRQSHLSDEGLSVLPYRCKNSVPPRSHAPIPPRFPGIFPTTRGSGASSARRSFQNLFGGWIRCRDTVVDVHERRSSEPCSGGRAPRGHAPGELPGECRSRSARDPRSRRPGAVRKTGSQHAIALSTASTRLAFLPRFFAPNLARTTTHPISAD